MLEQSVLTAVEKFLAAVGSQGIVIEQAVVFGSQAKGHAQALSDIDLLVISPQFDDMEDRRYITLLWRLAARTDSRIEPIPCGSRQWREDDSSAIIEIARREGELLFRGQVEFVLAEADKPGAEFTPLATVHDQWAGKRKALLKQAGKSQP